VLRLDARERSGLVAAAAVFTAAAASLAGGVAAAHSGHGARLSPAELNAEFTAADREQGLHEFRAAVRRLDRVIAADPRHIGALLMRANIEIVLGEFPAARRDCNAVLKAGAALAGSVCLASAQTGPGSLARARRMLASLPAGAAEPVVEAWRLTTEADLALRDDDLEAALGLLERAHASIPDDEEIRTRLAGVLLGAGDAERALAIAKASPDGSSLARRVVLARAALLADDANAWVYRQQAENAIRDSRGDHEVQHDREEAQAALYLAGDAGRALGHARRNFELQKDTADLRVWVEAALAAGSAADLRAARDWLAVSGFEDRVVSARLEGAEIGM
jgi:tetratricopeptide (TPR) repeat protein